MKKKILIVDDDEIFQKVIHRAFNKYVNIDEFEVLQYENGREAYQYLSSCKDESELPFISLLDINMPYMDGHELLEKIRGDRLLNKMVVFMLSTSNMQDDIDKAYNNNVAGYLVKTSFDSKYSNLCTFINTYLDNVNVLPDSYS